jgi:hypothetical protein
MASFGYPQAKEHPPQSVALSTGKLYIMSDNELLSLKLVDKYSTAIF